MTIEQELAQALQRVLSIVRSAGEFEKEIPHWLEHAKSAFIEADEALARYTASLTAPKGEAVAWIRYKDYNGTRPVTVHLCDPDDEGAIAVYTHPANDGAVPDGFVLVPVEPTPEMLNVYKQWHRDGKGYMDVSIYKAMIEAFRQQYESKAKELGEKEQDSPLLAEAWEAHKKALAALEAEMRKLVP